MKRFYCTTCKRQVRVRKLPDNVRPIVDDLTGLVTRYTDGTCRHHASTLPRRVLQDRVRTRPIPTRRFVPVAAPVPSTEGKGKGNGKGKGKSQRKAS